MDGIDIGLSFLEGLALIVSPCILPILPLILSTSIQGGKGRPYGIICGFIFAFTAFALLSRKLVMLLGINLDYIQYGSLVLLALFGLILMSEKLSAKFSILTQSFADAGAQWSGNVRGGFVSGVLIGLLIGLVWTPCAGPILAAALVQIIREQSDTHALLLILAFGIGAGVPMLLIALIGRKMVITLSFFTRHAEGVRKIFGVIILLAVAVIASGANLSSFSQPPQNNQTENINSNALQDALSHPYPAPEFSGITAWLNSPPLTMKDLRGLVVLVDFWTYSCINCIRTLPYITEWDRKYRDQGLVIVGVHSPEFEFEKSQQNVAAAIKKYHIAYPVAMDNNLDTWKNFDNSYWPAHYLINKQGQVVYTHFGEGNYAETENNIRVLLGLNKIHDETSREHGNYEPMTGETYLGYARSTHFESPEWIKKNEATQYSLPKFLSGSHWALSGSWNITEQYVSSESNGAILQLNFTAQKVFLVLRSHSGAPISGTVTLNGEPVGTNAGVDAPEGHFTVERAALYELIDQKEVKNGLLEIRVDTPGFRAYAFTFG